MPRWWPISARADFRGSDAAASLKLRRRLRGGDVAPGFPRQRCRGLIEAISGAGEFSMNGTDFRGSDAAASLKPYLRRGRGG